MGHWLIFIGSSLAIIGGFLVGRASERQAEENRQLEDQRSKLLAEVRDLSAKNVSLSEKNVALSTTVASIATGGDSFFYVELRQFGTTSATAALIHQGNYAVRDAVVEVFDLNGIEQSFFASPYQVLEKADRLRVSKIDALAAHQRMKWESFTFPASADRTLHSYYVQINALNTTVEQVIQVELVDGDWKQAYVVRRLEVIDGQRRSAELIRHIDPGFPYEGNPARLAPLGTKP